MTNGVPRNQEVIRQWKLLHELGASRHGVALDALAAELRVTTRTIRRDLAALQEAGFPLYDVHDDDGRVRWRMEAQALKGLDTGFTLSELCALYLSRHLLESVAGMPFQRDLSHAFARLSQALSPRMRQFLDRLPLVLTAKPGPNAGRTESSDDTVALLLEATLQGRAVTMRYHSVSSDRIKDYVVHPYRLAFAQGQMYLLAFVPAYDDVRTFALERIRTVSLETDTFTQTRSVPDDVFANSLGVHTGPAERVEIEFAGRVAPYVRARVWHPSQELRDRPDGSLVMTLHVCHDWALHSWILGWGPFARVVAPSSLAADVHDALTQALGQYSSATAAAS